MHGREWKRVVLMVFAWAVATALPAYAQLISGPAAIDLGVNYVADIANAHPGACGCFAMQGGGVNAALKINSHVALAADFTVVNTNTVSGANYGLGLMTIMAGPQLKLPAGRYTPYAQILFGAVHGFNSVFPGNAGSTANGFAVEVGAGSELRLNRRFSLRLLEADYMRTNLPNNVNNWQNHLKIATGLIYHF
ncbi:MAG: outer membrane beta-barrel protein [Acidobacteriaceae bacterium]|nr:outer membrane beta-barrel protein [Acidobacteriaceae bacterium]